uniref:Uncharacterized protein n=1 Tax=Chromera velia CCMP2878 TaxID=1169474 RepID=A0A0G4FLV3_9ALVE|eukprot:Cvel_17607.t1-p1 / transcript=Cvel_17607.t1 / gene=Cvel_17607 / organism=Chromera_velia_CCMP2878 / gene_product=hypothetical protein / transcript_product=hypothetical protein / location=Cvel_scaffold1416:16005-20254(+) / protein_length=795 / sequence_SO=supercontig / SO=protein_coding / is_pseudo=false
MQHLPDDFNRMKRRAWIDDIHRLEKDIGLQAAVLDVSKEDLVLLHRNGKKWEKDFDERLKEWKDKWKHPPADPEKSFFKDILSFFDGPSTLFDTPAKVLRKEPEELRKAAEAGRYSDWPGFQFSQIPTDLARDPKVNGMPKRLQYGRGDEALTSAAELRRKFEEAPGLTSRLPEGINLIGEKPGGRGAARGGLFRDAFHPSTSSSLPVAPEAFPFFFRDFESGQQKAAPRSFLSAFLSQGRKATQQQCEEKGHQERHQRTERQPPGSPYDKENEASGGEGNDPFGAVPLDWWRPQRRPLKPGDLFQIAPPGMELESHGVALGSSAVLSRSLTETLAKRISEHHMVLSSASSRVQRWWRWRTGRRVGFVPQMVLEVTQQRAETMRLQTLQKAREETERKRREENVKRMRIARTVANKWKSLVSERREAEKRKFVSGEREVEIPGLQVEKRTEEDEGDENERTGEQIEIPVSHQSTTTTPKQFNEPRHSTHRTSRTSFAPATPFQPPPPPSPPPQTSLNNHTHTASQSFTSRPAEEGKPSAMRRRSSGGTAKKVRFHFADDAEGFPSDEQKETKIDPSNAPQELPKEEKSKTPSQRNTPQDPLEIEKPPDDKTPERKLLQTKSPSLYEERPVPLEHFEQSGTFPFPLRPQDPSERRASAPAALALSFLFPPSKNSSSKVAETDASARDGTSEADPPVGLRGSRHSQTNLVRESGTEVQNDVFADDQEQKNESDPPSSGVSERVGKRDTHYDKEVNMKRDNTDSQNNDRTPSVPARRRSFSLRRGSFTLPLPPNCRRQ